MGYSMFSKVVKKSIVWDRICNKKRKKILKLVLLKLVLMVKTFENVLKLH